MRKIPALLAVLAVTAGVLAGCTAAPQTGCRPDTTDPVKTQELSAISVSGTSETLPVVEMHTPFVAPKTAYQDLICGSGTVITSENQIVVLDLVLVSARTGQSIVSTPYDGDLSRTASVTKWAETIPSLTTGLMGASEGSRVLLAISPDEVTEQLGAALRVEQGDSLVAVVDIRKVYLDRAEGKDEFNESHGLPTVVHAPNGRPGIIIPDATPPTDLVVQVLIRGNGPVVTGDASARLAYTGVDWGSRTVFDTTWPGAAKSVDLSTTVPGFEQAVKGQTVGSEILVVVPPALGYAGQANSTVDPDSTLVYVIDILGIDAPPPATQ